MDKLREEQGFSALVNAAVDGIVTINHEGIIERINPAIETIFGYEKNELLAQNVSILMPEFDSAGYDRILGKYIETGKEEIVGISKELIACKSDGVTFPVGLSIGAFNDLDLDKKGAKKAGPMKKGVTKFIAIIRDLSEQKEKEALLEKAELEIRDLIGNLSQVDRISTMGEMAAGIAHEINQPLTAINAYANSCLRMIDNGVADQEQIKKALAKISQQALRAGDIIAGMRKWVKQQDNEHIDCRIDVLLEDVLEIIKPELRDRAVIIKTSIVQPLPNIIVDPLQIQQVLINLIRNGVEAGFDKLGPQASIEIYLAVENLSDRRIKVSVTDPGAGVSEDLKDQLFNPFFTTKHHGMGLGLSICRTIIRSHGGELDFAVDPTTGTSFSFTLPTRC